MDPDEVLEKLEGLNNQVVQTYLDYLVTKVKSQNPEYHTRLACSYANDIQDEMKASSGLESFRELGKNQDLHWIRLLELTCFSTRTQSTISKAI